MFAGNFAPAGWMFCEGQLISIAENETLFQLIGTTYGGDGQTTFGLPDLRGRLPLHQGNGYILAEAGGAEAVTLSQNQIPAHNHFLTANADPTAELSPDPSGKVLAMPTSLDLYRTGTPGTGMQPGMLAPTGASQPHYNMQPFLCVNFIISLFGIFPSPT